MPIYCSPILSLFLFASLFLPIQALIIVSLSLTLGDCIHMLSKDRWGQHPTYSHHSEALTLVRKLSAQTRALAHTHTRMQTRRHCKCGCLHAAGPDQGRGWEFVGSLCQRLIPRHEHTEYTTYQ